MSISASDVVPFSQVRANFSELAEQVKAGSEKIITRNGVSYVALIDANRLDHYHQLERARIHLLLLDEAAQGLADRTAYLLSIRCHKQLSFDFARLWLERYQAQ